MSVKRRFRYRRDPVAVADRLGRYRRGGPGSEAAALQAAWAAAAGSAAAASSVVVRRSRAGVVTIACSDAIWAQELDSRREELTAALGAALPDPPTTGVRFVVADHAVPGPEPPAAPPPARPSEAQIAAARELVGDLDDPELREVLARAAAAQAAARRR